MAKKRERLEVIYDILMAVQNSNNAIKPTRLLSKSNLSPQMFKDYVADLVAKGFLLEIREAERRSFSLTQKGYDFLAQYKSIVQFIEQFGL